MSELLVGLINAGAELAEREIPRTIGGLLEEGRANAGDLSRRVNAALGEDLVDEESIVLVLDTLEGAKEPAKDVAMLTLAWVIGHLEDDDEANARRVWLEREANFDERQRAIENAGDAAQFERESREQAWEAFMVKVKAAGKVGLKILAALVLGALGL